MPVKANDLELTCPTVLPSLGLEIMVPSKKVMIFHSPRVAISRGRSVNPLVDAMK
jgi:hypothetical protein